MKKVCVGLIAGLLLSTTAFASPYSDLAQMRAAFFKATSWQIEEHLAGGRTLVVEYSAPDRWRFVPSRNLQEVIIGKDVYMVTDGHAVKLPPRYGTLIAQRMASRSKSDPLAGASKADLEKTARDLGTRTLHGKSVHVYSCIVRGVPETLYIGPDQLPVRAVMNGVMIKGKRVNIVADFSRFNKPIAIDPPAS